MYRRVGLAVVLTLLSNPVMAQDKPIAHHYFSKTPPRHAASWGYAGSEGPAHWGTLDPSYRLASDGRHQSPIDINSKQSPVAELPELKFDYRRENIAVLNNGHTIQHNESPGSLLYVGDQKFALEQFHMHAPSEHTVDGRHFDMEIHFVHKSASGEVAVVGVFVKRDENSTLTTPLLNDLPESSGELVTLEGSRNPSDFLPRSREYFSYAGSFTTPPCTENIRCLVMKQPIGVVPEVVDRFAAILRSNNRPVQMLNHRIVERSR